MRDINSRLLANRIVSQSLEGGEEIANMDGDGFEIVPDSRAQVVGAQVTKAMYGVVR